MFVFRKDIIEIIHALSDELVNFGYDKYFTPNMISSLKNISLKLNLRHAENITFIPNLIQNCMIQGWTVRIKG